MITSVSCSGVNNITSIYILYFFLVYLDRLHKTGMQIVIIHSIDMNKKYGK